MLEFSFENCGTGNAFKNWRLSREYTGILRWTGMQHPRTLDPMFAYNHNLPQDQIGDFFFVSCRLKTLGYWYER